MSLPLFFQKLIKGSLNPWFHDVSRKGFNIYSTDLTINLHILWPIEILLQVPSLPGPAASRLHVVFHLFHTCFTMSWGVNI